MADASTITSNSPVAGIQLPASPIGPLLDIFKYLGGTKGTSAGTESGSGVTTQTGETGPLEAILAQLSDPNNLANLVSNLFSQGAAQVPGLTTQFANATGSRVSNNSMLSQSLAALNQNIAQSISQAVVQQQQTAATAAGKLAEVNKTGTTTQNKTAAQTTTQAPGSLSTAAGGAGAALLAGTLLNKLGKKTGIFGDDPAKTASVSATPADTADVQNFGYPSGLATAPNAVDQAAFANAGNFAGDAAPIANTVDATNSGAIDAGTEVDTGGLASDASSIANSDTLDIVPSATDEFANDFSGLFVDGGNVGGTVNRQIPVRILASKPPYGYADGGNVVRNVPQMGAPAGGAPVSPAINFVLSPDPAQLSGGATGATAALKKRGSDGVNVTASGPAEGGTLVSPGGGEPAANAVGEGTNSPGVGIGGALGIAAAALSGLGIAGIGLATGKAVAVNQVAQALAGVDGVNTAAGLAVSADSDANAANSAGIASAEAGGFDVGNGTGEPIGADAPAATDAGNAGIGATADAGAATGANGDGTSSSGDGGGAGGGGDGGEADGGPIGGKKKRGAYADGGRIKPQSKHDLMGIDRQSIKVTPGEYMLPIDTTNFVGRELLDDLVALTHTTVRG